MLILLRPEEEDQCGSGWEVLTLLCTACSSSREYSSSRAAVFISPTPPNPPSTPSMLGALSGRESSSALMDRKASDRMLAICCWSGAESSGEEPLTCSRSRETGEPPPSVWSTLRICSWSRSVWLSGLRVKSVFRSLWLISDQSLNQVSLFYCSSISSDGVISTWLVSCSVQLHHITTHDDDISFSVITEIQEKLHTQTFCATWSRWAQWSLLHSFSNYTSPC